MTLFSSLDPFLSSPTSLEAEDERTPPSTAARTRSSFAAHLHGASSSDTHAGPSADAEANTQSTDVSTVYNVDAVTRSYGSPFETDWTDVPRPTLGSTPTYAPGTFIVAYVPQHPEAGATTATQNLNTAPAPVLPIPIPIPIPAKDADDWTQIFTDSPDSTGSFQLYKGPRPPPPQGPRAGARTTVVKGGFGLEAAPADERPKRDSIIPPPTVSVSGNVNIRKVSLLRSRSNARAGKSARVGARAIPAAAALDDAAPELERDTSADTSAPCTALQTPALEPTGVSVEDIHRLQVRHNLPDLSTAANPSDRDSADLVIDDINPFLSDNDLSAEAEAKAKAQAQAEAKAKAKAKAKAWGQNGVNVKMHSDLTTRRTLDPFVICTAGPGAGRRSSSAGISERQQDQQDQEDPFECTECLDNQALGSSQRSSSYNRCCGHEASPSPASPASSGFSSSGLALATGNTTSARRRSRSMAWKLEERRVAEGAADGEGRGKVTLLYRVDIMWWLNV